MSFQRGLHNLFLVILSASTAAHAQAGLKAPPAPPTPGKSLPATAGPLWIARSFPAEGIETVILRAGAAEQAQVVVVPSSRVVTVSGVPAGGTAGYHPADPNWKETPASQWGLDFQAKAFGPTLVISSNAEISYIHHYYHLDAIRIAVPRGVRVIRENRKLAGGGQPDLGPPVAR